jgi:hypothetical protein
MAGAVVQALPFGLAIGVPGGRRLRRGRVLAGLRALDRKGDFGQAADPTRPVSCQEGYLSGAG